MRRFQKSEYKVAFSVVVEWLRRVSCRRSGLRRLSGTVRESMIALTRKSCTRGEVKLPERIATDSNELLEGPRTHSRAHSIM